MERLALSRRGEEEVASAAAAAADAVRRLPSVEDVVSGLAVNVEGLVNLNFITMRGEKNGCAFNFNFVFLEKVEAYAKSFCVSGLCVCRNLCRGWNSRHGPPAPRQWRATLVSCLIPFNRCCVG